MAYKCPTCLKTFVKKELIISHFETVHKDDIPEDMSTAQYIYSLIHGRSSGICRYCGGLTPWNEKAGKPYQICGSPSCREKNKKIAEERMMRVYGKTSLLDDPLQQEKMLANRSISGTYVWSDGKHKFTYTGTYEKFAIEWLDKVMDLDPDTIQMPGPVLEYDFEGEKKNWITDMYLTEFNLIVEIKDGNENAHPGFSINREKEKAKDYVMMHQTDYNYVKITHKNMMQLVKVLTDIRLKNIFMPNSVVDRANYLKEKKDPVVVINESAIAVLTETAKGKLKFINDKGEKVPDVCPKCGSKVGVFFRGEPVFCCSNKECNAYYGTVPCNNESVTDVKPLGKKRWHLEETGIKQIKMLYNEASGHKEEYEKIKAAIENTPADVYVTADIHIGRPKNDMDIDKFVTDAVGKINKLIGANCYLILLGDIVTKDHDDEFVKKYTKEFLDRLNCKNVILVLGNNDNLTVKEYYDLGYYYVTDRIDTKDILFTHAPDQVAGEKYNFHGHIHNDNKIVNCNAENHVNTYYFLGDPGLLNINQYINLYKSGGYKYLTTIYKEN